MVDAAPHWKMPKLGVVSYELPDNVSHLYGVYARWNRVVTPRIAVGVAPAVGKEDSAGRRHFGGVVTGLRSLTVPISKVSTVQSLRRRRHREEENYW